MENARLIFRRDANAGVFDRHRNPIAPALGFPRNFHSDGAIVSEATGIGHQVGQTLAKAREIRVKLRAAGRRAAGQPVAVAGRQRADGREDVIDHIQHIEGIRRHNDAAGLGLGVVEHLIHQAEENRSGSFDAREIPRDALNRALLAHVLQQLAVADDGIQRSAQLVAHGGQKPAFRVIVRFGRLFGNQGGPQVFHHGIEGLGQPADFIRTFHRGPAVQVARRDAAREIGQRVDGPQ